MNRRFFLLAAPAIVAAPSLMRVSAAVLDALLPASADEAISVAATPYYGFETILQTALRNRSRLLAEQITRSNEILRRWGHSPHKPIDFQSLS